MIDYRIIRYFFFLAYPDIDFNLVRVTFANRNTDVYRLDDERIHLRKFVVTFRHPGFDHVGEIRFGYSERFKTLIVCERSYCSGRRKL